MLCLEMTKSGEVFEYDSHYFDLHYRKDGKMTEEDKKRIRSELASLRRQESARHLIKKGKPVLYRGIVVCAFLFLFIVAIGVYK